MEAAGLAIGIMGLCGLFDAILNMTERLRSYKTHDKDKHRVETQLAGHKQALERWACDVGLADGTVAASHSRRLDDAETRRIVEALLHIMNDELREFLDANSPDHASAAPASTDSDGARPSWDWRKKPPSYPKLKDKMNKKLSKAGWALGGKGGSEEKEAIMRHAIDQLRILVPPPDELLKETDSKVTELLEMKNSEYRHVHSPVPQLG